MQYRDQLRDALKYKVSYILTLISSGFCSSAVFVHVIRTDTENLLCFTKCLADTSQFQAAAAPYHLVNRKDEFFPQCETGLRHLLLCIWIASLSAHLSIHCCQDGENIFSSAKTQVRFVLGRQLTSEKLPHSYTSWSIPAFKQASKQLTNLLWKNLHGVALSNITAFILSKHSRRISSISAFKSNFCRSEGKYACSQKEAYGNIVTEDSCIPSAGTTPVCTRSPALGFCRKHNLAG